MGNNMMTIQACPLCGSDKKMHKAKLLYGTPVCRKCLYKFANRRQIGYVIDVFVWWTISFFLGMALVVFFELLNVSVLVPDEVVIFMRWIIYPLIFSCKDGFGGHSPGKFICGVQVVHSETLQPQGFGSSFKRNLILMVPFMPLVIAFLLNKGHRLGDGWAQSKVIWKKYAQHPVFTGLAACEKCHYDLRANTTGICPECGTPLSTYNQMHLAEATMPPVVRS